MLHPTTVLVADPHPDCRRIYRHILEHLGYAALEATNRAEILAQMREFSPDLVLMEPSMEGPKGWELVAELKGSPEFGDVPIVAVTAYAMAKDRVQAYEVGCDGYLPKPCSPRLVVAEVERLVGAHTATSKG
ncbi:MAG TPA: response regulator [Longimicrobiaceae bacterium]|nr:response regulator [Longimicrobiaceae bacterium]